jgi:hypothetical protein
VQRWVCRQFTFAIAYCIISAWARHCAAQTFDNTPTGPNPLNPWLHHGLLITGRWYGSSHPGHATDFKQDEGGNWVGSDGARLEASNHGGSAAGGISQSLISCVGKDRVILVCESYTDMRLFGFADPVLQGNPVTFAAPVDRCDLWIAPAKLAQMQSDPTTHTIVQQCKWKMGDQVFDAVSISSASESQWINHIYERNHGFCLHAAESSTEASPQLRYLAPGDTRAGDSLLSEFDVLAIRDVHTPWSEDPMPDWTGQFKVLHYSGQMVSNRFGSRPTQLFLDVTRNDSRKDWLSVTNEGGVVYMGQPQQGKKSLFLCGTDQYETFAAGPAVLSKLAAGQVLDVDPITHVQTRVTQADGNSVTIESASGGTDSFRTFDLQTGKVISFGRTNRLTKVTITFQLQGQE